MAGGEGRGGMEIDALLETEFSFWLVKMFWN